jgi:hypothetical protein
MRRQGILTPCSLIFGKSGSEYRRNFDGLGINRFMALKMSSSWRNIAPVSNPSFEQREIIMREALIVSSARTGLAKSGRGGFNMTHGAAMGGHAIKHAVERAGIDAGDVEDVIMGCGTPEGATGQNVGRLAAIWAGCPVTTSGVTVNRFCSSGLQTIAMAAGRVLNENVPVTVGADD